MQYTVTILGSGSEPQLPVNHKQPIHLESFCFSISVQYSRNYMTYSTFWYKIGFVLHGFAQLQANVGILSTFKGG